MLEIDISFVDYSDITNDDLADLLLKKGFQLNEFNVQNQVLLTKNLDIAIYVNKIHAYTNTLENQPYFMLKVIHEEEEYICITYNPWSIKSDISYEDEIVKLHKSEDLNEVFIVDPATSYLNIKRDNLRKKYFDEQGGLLIKKYRYLNDDYNFIYALIKKGFYAYIGDEAGYLFIE